jgi:hypothetical protein
MLEVESVIHVSFLIFSKLCIYSIRMRTYLHTAFTVIDRYDILIDGHKSDASVGSGCRRRFLD